MSTSHNNNNTNAAANGGSPARRTRAQYHYVYGSMASTSTTTTTTTTTANDDAERARLLSASSDANISTSDGDSLLGESLVPTDNEEDQPTMSRGADFQHVLTTRGTTSSLIPQQQRNGVTGSSSGSSGVNGFRHPKDADAWPCLVWRARHPFGFAWLCLGAAILATGVVATLWWPTTSSSNVPSSSSSGYSNSGNKRDLAYQVPFPRVDRATYQDAVPAFVRLELLEPFVVNNNDSSSPSLQFPFPTGAFWTNFILHATADQGLSYPIAVYPYAYKWSDALLQLSYPAAHRQTGPEAVHDYFMPDLSWSFAEATAKRYIAGFDPLSVTLKYELEGKGAMVAHLVQGSPYMTMELTHATPQLDVWGVLSAVTCPKDADLAALEGQGRRHLRYGVCSQHDDLANHATTLHGVQFILQNANGMIWYLFASEPITWTFDTQDRRKLVVTEAFTGVLRVAMVPNSPTTTGSTSTDDDSSSSAYLKSSGLARLINHAGVYPTGASLAWTFGPPESTDTSTTSSNTNMATKTVTGLAMATAQKSVPVEHASRSTSGSSSSSSASSARDMPDRVARLSFKFTTQSFTEQSSATPPNPLLMLALPHHTVSTGVLGSDSFDLKFQCIKGTLRPVLGSTWSYDIALPTFGLDGDVGSTWKSRQAVKDLNKIRPLLISNLARDVKMFLPTTKMNIYGYGKQIARLAQLAHIGVMLQATHSEANSTISSTSAETLKTIIDEASRHLRESLDLLLSGNVSDSLVFDENLGGIVSVDGLQDSNADFGNGRYNDHHFHYGYLLYACAIMGTLDENFIKDYGKKVDAIMYDVAYDGNYASTHSPTTGPFFPAARHKSWFDGHSYASGLFAFGNGKSQESSSEAVNCYYGTYLWSLVRNGSIRKPEDDISPRTDFARLLLAMELKGAKTYWQMMPYLPGSNRTSTQPMIYNQQFSQNYMVGNIGMLDAIAKTWFGNQPLFVHMINFLPVTTAAGELFSETYATREYNAVLSKIEAEPAWKGFVVADHAISDPNAAWKEAQKISSETLDPGLSKSQLLYWIATRKGFTAPNTTAESEPVLSGEKPASSSSAACAANKQCAELDLLGECCPTEQGTFLGCCAR